MTKEEILAMKAGRELDVLVAQKVLDIEVEWDYPPWDVDKILPKLPFRKGEPRTCVGPMAHPIADTVYKYSTDISSAWQVVEALRSMKDGKDNQLLCCLEIFSDYGNCWEIRWAYSELSTYNDGHKRHYSDCFDDFPEAICKAALLIKLKEVKHD